jgi:hypothetical protein
MLPTCFVLELGGDWGVAAQLPEAVWTEACVRIPQIIAGEVDVLPGDGGEVSKQRVRDHFAAATQVIAPSISRT